MENYGQKFNLITNFNEILMTKSCGNTFDLNKVKMKYLRE